MTFNQEWAGLMSEAKERQPVGMRLNAGRILPAPLGPVRPST